MFDTVKVSKGAKIRNQYNRVPHLIQDTIRKVTNSQLDTTNESQEVSPFPAGDHKAHINRRKHKTEQKHKRSTKEVSQDGPLYMAVDWDIKTRTKNLQKYYKIKLDASCI